MANYGIKIDLLKLKGAFMRNLKGKEATMEVNGTLGQDAFAPSDDDLPF